MDVFDFKDKKFTREDPLVFPREILDYKKPLPYTVEGSMGRIDWIVVTKAEGRTSRGSSQV